MRTHKCRLSLLIGLLPFAVACSLLEPRKMQPFPASYIDSAYALPNGSAIYFLHSVVSTLEILEQNPSARPVTDHLPGHQSKDGGYWWNTDLYVSYKNPDGTWGQPQNLGPNINSEHMESSPWVNNDQTVLIYTRESLSDAELSGTFISHRESPDDPWGIPKRLPGELGMYGTTGYMDFHMTPSGNLYFWSELIEGNGTLYWARSIGPNQWSEAEQMPDYLQSELHETQPWVNDEETVLYFNRRGDDANTQLLRAARENSSVSWGPAEVVPLKGFSDANGYTVWGEPSFLRDGTMFFVRFDTSVENWCSEILVAKHQQDGSFGVPQRIIFGD
jgi:hypothetical protein